jgi:hypothetical protein
MVKPGPVSKKKEVMLEILNLLSKKAYGFRELHRSLPEGRRAGSFATLHDCLSILKSRGLINIDPKTKKIRITLNGELERNKQRVIDEIGQAKVVACYSSSSDTGPISYELSLAKYCKDGEQSCSRLTELLRSDSSEINLLPLSCFLFKILQNSDGERQTDRKQAFDDVKYRMQNELPPDAEVLNVFSIDIRRFLLWLETPTGASILEYLLEQKHEGKLDKIQRLTNFFPATMPSESPYSNEKAERKNHGRENAGNRGKRRRTRRER